MADKHYIWKGPSTGIEVWTETDPAAAPELIFSGQVATDRLIGTPLPSDHSQVAGWLAFKLIEEAPAAKAQAPAETTEPPKKKERTDG
jgi:hypothetical protein